MYILDSMKIRAKKEDVLATLRKNRETHGTIVAEARKGYVDRALHALEAKRERLVAGKITALVFELHVPVDRTSVYDTAIRMLELHQDELIELDAGQVRNLMEDKWDWTRDFYTTNSQYSNTAAVAAVGIGGDDE